MAVEEYGRLWFAVDSHSREGMRHFVDLEPELDNQGHPIPGGEPYQCSCESFALRLDRPCRHAVEVLEYLLPVVQHLKHWQPPAPKKEPPQLKRTYKLKKRP